VHLTLFNSMCLRDVLCGSLGVMKFDIEFMVLYFFDEKLLLLILICFACDLELPLIVVFACDVLPCLV